MAMILNCSIDLSKIDETKVIQGKNGARYYNFTVMVKDEKNKAWAVDYIDNNEGIQIIVDCQYLEHENIKQF